MAHNGKDTTDRNALSSAKRALLEQRLQKALASDTQAAAIPRRPEPDSAPLSFGQERLWFRDQWEPGSPALNRPVSLRLAGPLDVPALEQVLGEILQRHETLRAAFPTEGRQVRQVISPHRPVALRVEDLTRWPAAERESQARHLAAEEAQQPLSLAEGPLLRARLLRLDQEDHVLLLVIHHIVFDGWSAQVLIRELAALYTAYSTGKASPLPDLTIQYTDFAFWQRGQLKDDVLEGELAYWKQALGGRPQALELPTDSPRPAVLTYQGARHSLALPQHLTNALRAMGDQESVTLYMVLLAAFQTLLHRIAGQDDILVCTPIANRSQVELEALIGYFNNIIVMRTNLAGDPSFRRFLERVSHVVLGAYEHQDLPFQKLAELPSLAHTPLARVLFALQSFPSEPPQIPGLKVSSFEFDRGAADFELSLFVEQRGHSLTCVIEHKTDLYDKATAKRMLGQFRTVLERAVADPEQPLSALLPAEELSPSTQVADASRTGGQPLAARPRPDLGAPFVEPRDRIERQVVDVWQEVLGIQPIGVQDDFFALGGNSLLAMRLFARLDSTCGSPDSLASFFQTPTVEQIARLLGGEGAPAPVDGEEDQQLADAAPMRDTFWRGLRNRVCQVAALYAPGFKTTRVRLHRMRGVRIGQNVSIGTSVIIETAYPQLVSIGNNVSISMRSVIVAHFRESTDRAKSRDEASVRIEDNVYIGAGAIILPNVTIGDGSVVTAGSVVSQSVPPLTMVQGNPARPVARCGVPLAGNSYEHFVRNLRPIED